MIPNSIRKRVDGPTLRFEADGLMSMLDEIESAGGEPLERLDSCTRISLEWLGLPRRFAGVDGLRRAIGGGVEELTVAVDRMREMIDVEVPRDQRTRRLRRHLDAGDELCELAWLRRDPEGWSEVRRSAGPTRTMTVAVNVAMLSWMRPEHLLWRGAAAVAVVDLLESRGVRVELRSVSCSQFEANELPRLDQGTGKEALVVSDVLLKRCQEPVCVATLAFALACPAAFRAVTMNWRGVKTSTSGEFGATREMPPELASKFDLVIDSSVLDMEAALAAVRQLNTKGTSAP